MCEQPKVAGPCKALMPRFHYNKDTKKCEKFDYGGCMGNENNFEKIEDCSKKCIDVPVKPSYPSKCSLKAEAGPCRAAFKRFYFNSTSKSCEEFIYGGCQGFYL